MKPDHPEQPRSGVSKEEQLELFKAGVAHLGSVEAAARWMEINVRSLRYVLNARRALHDGHCRALANALVAHTAVSREIERRISPAFRDNLTAEQATKKPHGNRFDQRAREKLLKQFDDGGMLIKYPHDGPLDLRPGTFHILREDRDNG